MEQPAGAATAALRLRSPDGDSGRAAAGGQEAQPAPPAALPPGPGPALLHQRHHGHAQGGHAEPPEPGLLRHQPPVRAQPAPHSRSALTPFSCTSPCLSPTLPACHGQKAPGYIGSDDFTSTGSLRCWPLLESTLLIVHATGNANVRIELSTVQMTCTAHTCPWPTSTSVAPSPLVQLLAPASAFTGVHLAEITPLQAVNRGSCLRGEITRVVPFGREMLLPLLHSSICPMTCIILRGEYSSH